MDLVHGWRPARQSAIVFRVRCVRLKSNWLVLDVSLHLNETKIENSRRNR